MSGSFLPTGSYSNLTRLELEQLRRADFGVAGKALTTGTAAGPDANVNAESFATSPFITLERALSITPPTAPGDGLVTLTQVALPSSGFTLNASETVQWFGPRIIASGSSGQATAPGVWNTGAVDVAAAGVVAGDILLVKPKTGPTTDNAWATGVVLGVAGSFDIGLSVPLRNPTFSTPTQLDTSPAGDLYQWLVIRTGVVQLYAVPGSGPLGQEQAFLFVKPVALNTGVHADPGLNLSNLAAQRILNIIPPTSGANPAHRSDAIYGPVNKALNELGYRVVLYPDLGNGLGPDLSTPIDAINPTIDGAISPDDQRMTIDYASGVIRFSTAPTLTGQLKKAGATNGASPTTGRLNLYATFWAADVTATAKTANSLYEVRSTNSATTAPGRIRWNATRWQIDPGLLVQGAAEVSTDLTVLGAALLQTLQTTSTTGNANVARQVAMVPAAGTSGVLAPFKTLIYQTNKTSPNFAAVRFYSTEPHGLADYGYLDITLNCSWDSTIGRWVKDQGSGSFASKLELTNGTLSFKRETSAASIFLDFSGVFKSGSNASESTFGGQIVSLSGGESFITHPPVRVGDFITITSGPNAGETRTVTLVYPFPGPGGGVTVDVDSNFPTPNAGGPHTWEVRPSAAWEETGGGLVNNDPIGEMPYDILATSPTDLGGGNSVQVAVYYPKVFASAPSSHVFLPGGLFINCSGPPLYAGTYNTKMSAILSVTPTLTGRFTRASGLMRVM